MRDIVFRASSHCFVVFHEDLRARLDVRHCDENHDPGRAVVIRLVDIVDDQIKRRAENGVAGKNSVVTARRAICVDSHRHVEVVRVLRPPHCICEIVNKLSLLMNC